MEVPATGAGWRVRADTGKGWGHHWVGHCCATIHGDMEK